MTHSSPRKWLMPSFLMLIVLMLIAIIFLLPMPEIETESSFTYVIAILSSDFPLVSTYFAFVVSIFAMAYLARNRNADYLFAFGACAYALVFLGFWIKFTAGSLYQQYGYSETPYLLSSGHIPFQISNFPYRSLPGLDIITAAYTLIIGKGVFYTGPVLLIVFSMVLCLSLFVLFQRLLDNSSYAWLALITLITGCQVFTDSASLFWGGALSFPLFGLLLLLLLFSKIRSGVSAYIMIVMVFAALTLSYMPAAGLAMLFYLLLCVFTDRSFKKIMLLPIIFLVINLYLSLENFGPVLTWVSFQIQASMTDPLTTLLQTIVNPVRIAASGLAIPVWAQIIQPLWVAILIPIALLISLTTIVRTLRQRRFASINGWLVIGIASSIIGAIIGGLAISGGPELVGRLIEYVPFFSVPLLFASLKSFRPKIRQIALVLVVSLLIILSLPTFIIDHKNEGILIDAQSTQQALSFVSSTYGLGSGLSLYTSAIDSAGADMLYLPLASYVSEGGNAYLLAGSNQNEAWLALDNVILSFLATHSGSVYVWSPKMYVEMESIFGIPPSDSHWAALTQKLGSESDAIFSSGSTTVYFPR